MRKIKITLVALIISITSFADEGMWLPMFLQQMNYAEMKGLGLQLTPEQIYNINNSSVKDAIVKMGGGFCTGEIISSEGLLLTNHHCGYDFIQQHSTVDKNLLAEAGVLPDEKLLADMGKYNEELAKALADQVLGPLLALPDNDRAAVFETLQAYVEGSGSVAEIASTTLRHRNTVRNRLQTVERITGLSLSKPRDVAAISLAMAWIRGPGAHESTH